MIWTFIAVVDVLSLWLFFFVDMVGSNGMANYFFFLL
jgi:hypothetical protein